MSNDDYMCSTLGRLPIPNPEEDKIVFLQKLLDFHYDTIQLAETKRDQTLVELQSIRNLASEGINDSDLRDEISVVEADLLDIESKFESLAAAMREGIELIKEEISKEYPSR